MNRRCAILIICFLGILIPQTSFAKATINTDKTLYDQAEVYLKQKDTLKACAIYRRIKAETDSVAQINYQKEVKAKRTVYQIDELYLENKQQEAIILKRICWFLFVVILLLVATFYYLRTRNRKLEQARINARKLEKEAELSIQNKTKLLYTITKEMTGSLAEMKKITASMQTTDAALSQEGRNYLSYLRSSAEKLQRIYNQIFS